MKKLFLAFTLASSLMACKKESTNSSLNSTSKNDSDKSNINFSAIGTVVGSFQNNVTDLDGNTYKTVKIGSQIWMAENLKTSKYNDGTVIPNIPEIDKWMNDSIGAWVYYNNDSANNKKYGKLYNWYAVSPTMNGNKNVCPTGWHVPTDSEWTVLTDFLGGTYDASDKMKEIGFSSWIKSNTNATNTSLFTGIPGGYRGYEGGYGLIGYDGYWWSSSEFDTYGATLFYLVYANGTSYLDHWGKKFGHSLRCVKN